MDERPSPPSERAIHWESAYATRSATGVSWFQLVPVVTLELIELLEVPRTASIIDVGGGASTLVDHLVELGYADLSVLDISEAALCAARLRLGHKALVSWLHEDLLSWRPARRYTVWHDRAVFHFLIHEADRTAYLNALNEGLAPGGTLIMATFADDGPEYCSGLPVARYSDEELAAVLGDRFAVIDTRREEHVTPSGAVQPFTWVAARQNPVS